MVPVDETRLDFLATATGEDTVAVGGLPKILDGSSVEPGFKCAWDIFTLETGPMGVVAGVVVSGS